MIRNGNAPDAFIIFEGPDNVGKTSLARAVSKQLGANLISQPSERNSIGFLRNVLKQFTGLSPLARQLGHTCSHITDLLEQVDGDIIVFDRSFLSAIVYGKIMGLTEQEQELVKNLNLAVYKNYVNINKTKVIIVHLTNQEPFKEEDDEVFKVLDWTKLRDEYASLVEKLKTEEEEFIEFSEVIKINNYKDQFDDVVKDTVFFIKEALKKYDIYTLD